jgi:hypothetical protein
LQDCLEAAMQALLESGFSALLTSSIAADGVPLGGQGAWEEVLLKCLQTCYFDTQRFAAERQRPAAEVAV